MKEGPADQHVIGRRIDADRKIVALLDHVDRSIIGGDLEPDVRIKAYELGGYSTHRDLREQERRADAERSADMFAARGNSGGSFFEFGQQGSGTLKKRGAFLSQFEIA